MIFITKQKHHFYYFIIDTDIKYYLYIKVNNLKKLCKFSIFLNFIKIFINMLIR